MCRYLFLFLLFGALLPDAAAQDEKARLGKYGWMRYRLRHYFMHMGEDEGESLPAGIVKEYYHCYADRSPARLIDWGDGTIYHGWYLGVLGTEAGLLRMQGQPLDSTARELYLALQAFDRLDYNAEIIWSNYNGATERAHMAAIPWNADTRSWEGKAPGVVNGFFLRNDAPPDFIKHFPFAGALGSALSAVYDSSDRKYLGEYRICPPFVYRADTYYPMNEPSHDQIFPLLMGLTLSYRCASGIYWEGQDLGERARLTALRIIDFYDQSWKIRNPVRTQYGSGCNSEGCLPFNGGGNSIAYAYPLAVLANYLRRDVSYCGDPFIQPFKDIGNPYMSAAGFALGRVWKNLPPLFYHHHVNHHMEVSIGSVSNAYRAIRPWRGPEILWERTHRHNVGWEFYYLLNKFLYPNKTDYWATDSIEYELDLCPANGPHWFIRNKKHILSPPWNASLRYVHAFKNGRHWSREDSTNTWFKGYFSGLDYMLLHNIYRLVYPQQHTETYVLSHWLQNGFPQFEAGGFITSGIITDTLHIQLHIEEPPLYFVLEDAWGHVVQRLNGSAGSVKMNASGLDPGWYLLRSYTDAVCEKEYTLPIRLIKADAITSEP